MDVFINKVNTDFKAKLASHIKDLGKRKKYLDGIKDTYEIKNFEFDLNDIYIFEDGNNYVFRCCKNIKRIVSGNCDINFIDCHFDRSIRIYAFKNNLSIKGFNISSIVDTKRVEILANNLDVNNTTFNGDITIQANNIIADNLYITSTEYTADIHFKDAQFNNSVIRVVNNNYYDKMRKTYISGEIMELSNSHIVIDTPEPSSYINLSNQLLLKNKSTIDTYGSLFNINVPQTTINNSTIEAHAKKDVLPDLMNGYIKYNGILCRLINDKNIDKLGELTRLTSILEYVTNKASIKLDSLIKPIKDNEIEVINQSEAKIKKLESRSVINLIEKR